MTINLLINQNQTCCRNAGGLVFEKACMPIYPTQLHFILEKRFPHHPMLAWCVGREVTVEHMDENDEIHLDDLTDAINQAIIRIGGGDEISELAQHAKENNIDLEQVRKDARKYYVLYL